MAYSASKIFKNPPTTLLECAANPGCQENLRILKSLLTAGEDPNQKNCNGDTALHLVIKNSNISSSDRKDYISALIDVGANPNLENIKGETVLSLMDAQEARELDLIKLLIQAGARKGSAELFYCVAYSIPDFLAVEILQYLISVGMNHVDEKMYDMSILSWVATRAYADLTLRQNNRLETFKFLVSIANRETLNEALYMLEHVGFSKDSEAINILINAGANSEDALLAYAPPPPAASPPRHSPNHRGNSHSYDSSDELLSISSNRSSSYLRKNKPMFSAAILSSAASSSSQASNFIENAILDMAKTKTPYWELLNKHYNIDPVEIRKELGSLQMELRRELNHKLGEDHSNFAPAIQAAQARRVISKEQAKIYFRINKAANEAKHESQPVLPEGAVARHSRNFSGVFEGQSADPNGKRLFKKTSYAALSAKKNKNLSNIIASQSNFFNSSSAIDSTSPLLNEGEEGNKAEQTSVISKPITFQEKSTDKRVMIHVWECSKEHGEVGHVSLETDQIYVSFWPTPQRGGEQDQLKIKFLGVEGKFVTFEQDKGDKLENGEQTKKGARTADHTFTLYTLNVEAIHACFRKMQSRKWAQLGSSMFGMPGTSNCSSVVYELLIAGGIHSLVEPSALYVRDTRLYSLFIAALLLSLIYLLLVSPETLFTGPYFLIVSLGFLVNVGAVWDGLLEGYDLGRTLIARSKRESVVDSGFFFFIPLLGAILNTICSGIFLDNMTQKLLITPQHIARLVRRAEAVENSQNNPNEDQIEEIEPGKRFQLA